MTSHQVLEELKKAGSESIKKVLLKHGAKEPFYGVKIEHMKKIQKTIKEDKQKIALELYASGISDAQYMAGLMADGSQMTKKQLQEWADDARWEMITEYTVPWVASENEDGFELALKWIDSKKEAIASSGWNSIACIVSMWPDEDLDIPRLRKLMSRVEKEIHTAPNRVRYCMNSFVIATGSYVKELNKEAVATGKKIGNVMVDMGDTSCKVPFGPDYIKKAMDRGSLGKKKRTCKC